MYPSLGIHGLINLLNTDKPESMSFYLSQLVCRNQQPETCHSITVLFSEFKAKSKIMASAVMS